MKKEDLLGYTSLKREVQIEALEIRGSIPDWLNGTLLRNGPALFELPKFKITHFFDGFGMLHCFTFANGKVSYRNRFLRSNFYNNSIEAGTITSAWGFATDPCWGFFRKLVSFFIDTPYDNGCVNVSRLADRFVALTETPLLVKFNPKTLETLGIDDFKDNIKGQLTTAHPHFDFETGESFNYVTNFSLWSTYNVYKVPRSEGLRKLIASIGVCKPGYMHSFGLSKNYLILTESPFKVDPWRLALRLKPFIMNYKWLPNDGTRFILIQRDSAKVIECRTGPFCVFHHVNAFEDGGKLYVDLVSYKDASIIESFYIDALRGKRNVPIPGGRLTRFVIDVVKRSVNSVVLCQEFVELPRINYEKFNMCNYRYIYAIGTDSKVYYNRLIKIDLDTRKTRAWRSEGCFPGEPVFVRRSDSWEEDDGIILSVVLDARRQNSFLLLLNAKTFEEIGRADVPHHIPFGIHGNYYAI